ncbi:MAG: carboxypeptidase-like regulatory domain-containing protein, partial [Planctomycetota bacterium]|nr:carboxypeptidase-like regulatory domain-containing protein [Planctomycetota bacterium]
PGSVTFEGRVLDRHGRPASGVKIVMRGDGGLLELTAGADGRFKADARPGRYALWFDGAEQGGLVVGTYMLDGAPDEDLEFALREPAGVDVSVQRGADAVAEVAIEIVSRELGALVRQVGTTAGDGRAVFTDLPPGRYDVVAQVPQGPKVIHGLFATAGKTTTMRVSVPDGVLFKGVVRAGSEGPGVGGAQITLQTAARGSAGLLETVFATAPDGTFEVMVPRGSPRLVRVEAEGHAAWPAPQEASAVLRSLRGLAQTKGATPVERDIVLLSGAVVAGLVQTAEKAPVPALTLRLVRKGGPTHEVVTGADGRYVMANVVRGPYEVQIVTPGWFPIAGQPLRVGVPGGAEPKPTTFDLTVVGARQLSGFVVDAAGEGVAGARVWIVGGGVVVRSARDAGRELETFTGAHGGWVIGDIPPDKNVVVRAAMGTLEADPVSAPWQRPPPLPLRMPLQGTGTVAGRVVDLETRDPVAGATVRLVPEPHDGRTARSATTNGRGEFTIEAVLPGAWKLTPSHRSYLSGETDALTVSRGADSHADLRLDPGVVFAGVVVDAQGKPVRFARVNVRGTPVGKDKPVTRGATADALGRFSVSGLEAASYDVTIWRNGLRAVKMTERSRSERDLHIVLLPR